MRRTLTLAILAAMIVTIVGVPASAAPAEIFENSSNQMYATFSDGPQQVEFTVGESYGEMGIGFYVNLSICDYLAPGGSVCWEDTGENVVVHDFKITKKGGFLDADIEMRNAWNWSDPTEVIRVTAEFTPTDMQVVRTTNVSHDSEYGFTKSTSVSYTDQSPEVTLMFDEWLIDMILPPMTYAEFSLQKGKAVTKS
jgi:hypothetical protein